MTMNKFILAAVCGIVCTTAVFAQEDDVGANPEAAKAELKKMAENESVKEVLEEDGVSISFAEDGSYRAIARGTGTYDFDDPDDRKAAKEEAILEAKSALAHYLSETLASEKGLDKAIKTAKTLTKNGEVSTEAVSQENVKTKLTSIRNDAKAILTGVVTLESRKIPGKGDGGEIQVTIGTSPATVAAAKAVSNMMTDSLNDRRKVKGDGSNVGDGTVGNGTGGSASGSSAGAPATQTGPNPNNKPEVRKNKTIF